MTRLLVVSFLIGLSLFACTSTASASILGPLFEKTASIVKRTAPTPAPNYSRQVPKKSIQNGPYENEMPWKLNLPNTVSPIELLFSHKSQREPGRRDLLQNISRTFNTTPKLVRATVDSKKFGVSFRLGAKEGEARLHGVAENLQSLTSAWLKAGQHQRIFIIGVSESEQDAKVLKASLAASGYEVFFYKFCEFAIGQLCSAEEVGAFFATAGHVVVFKAPSLKPSDYVNVEIASAYSHKTGGLLLIFTPEELRKYLSISAAIPLVAAAFEIDNSDKRRQKKAQKKQGRANDE